MKLFEAIQDLKAMQNEAKDALKEAKDATSQSTLQRVFEESFNVELKGLESRLNEVSNEILGSKANELSTQNKQEMLSLFESQKSEIIKEAVGRLPLESLSNAIAKEFAEQNQKNLAVAINEAIGNTDSNLKKAISDCEKTLRIATTDFQNTIENKKQDILISADCLIYDYLHENPNAVFENMSEESIKGGIVEYFNANPMLLETINKEALRIAKERISFSLIQEEIQKLLESEAINGAFLLSSLFLFRNISSAYAVEEIRCDTCFKARAKKRLYRQSIFYQIRNTFVKQITRIKCKKSVHFRQFFLFRKY